MLTKPLSLAPKQYRESLGKVIHEYGITNPLEFLAMAYYESDYLQELQDPVDLTVGALLKKYPRKRISYDDAVAYGKGTSKPSNPEMIANRIYGGAWGEQELGNTEPGDGWKYRGTGPIRIQGKRAWTDFSNHIDRPDLVATPDTAMKEPTLVAQAAGWFWTHLHDFRVYGENMRAIAKAHTGSADTTIKTRTTYRDRLRNL